MVEYYIFIHSIIHKFTHSFSRLCWGSIRFEVLFGTGFRCESLMISAFNFNRLQTWGESNTYTHTHTFTHSHTCSVKHMSRKVWAQWGGSSCHIQDMENKWRDTYLFLPSISLLVSWTHSTKSPFHKTHILGVNVIMPVMIPVSKGNGFCILSSSLEGSLCSCFPCSCAVIFFQVLLYRRLIPPPKSTGITS